MQILIIFTYWFGFNKLDIKISDFVRDIKSDSSKLINEENWF